MPHLQTRYLVALVLTGLMLACPAGFQASGSTDSKYARATLRGLSGVAVIVESMDPEAERDGLMKSQVQTEVELRLRQAGIRVLSREDRLTTPGKPFLYINIHASKRSDINLYAYYVTVELNQSAWLDRDPAIDVPAATTWSISGGGSVGGQRLRSVREDVLDYVDRFINAYLAENPEQAIGRQPSRSEPVIPEASLIRAVQWQLQEAGFDPGPVDGKLGAQTRLALRQYQGKKGLPATGELDEATRRAFGLR
jgi:putative peptidoglycan binding protein